MTCTCADYYPDNQPPPKKESTSDWSRLTILSKHWPLIGRDWLFYLNTGLWLGDKYPGLEAGNRPSKPIPSDGSHLLNKCERFEMQWHGCLLEPGSGLLELINDLCITKSVRQGEGGRWYHSSNPSNLEHRMLFSENIATLSVSFRSNL